MEVDTQVGFASYVVGVTPSTKISIPYSGMKHLSLGQEFNYDGFHVVVKRRDKSLVISRYDATSKSSELPPYHSENFRVRMYQRYCSFFEGCASSLFKRTSKLWFDSTFEENSIIVPIPDKFAGLCNFKVVAEIEQPEIVQPIATEETPASFSEIPTLTALESSKYKLEYDYASGECWFRDTIIARKITDHGEGEDGWNTILDHLRKNGVKNPPVIETLMMWENGVTKGPKLKTMAPIAWALFGPKHRVIKAFNALIDGMDG